MFISGEERGRHQDFMLLVLLCSYAAVLFSFYVLFCHSIYVERQPVPASSSSTQGTWLQLHLKRKIDVTEALTDRQHVISPLVYPRVCTKPQQRKTD